ncbi:hypothetical protein GPU89_12565 [Burkholderia cepacia]|nr:hypothetical protein [Burkholderia cepacia]
MKTLPAREPGWRCAAFPAFRAKSSMAMGVSFAAVFPGHIHTEIHAKARNFDFDQENRAYRRPQTYAARESRALRGITGSVAPATAVIASTPTDRHRVAIHRDGRRNRIRHATIRRRRGHGAGWPDVPPAFRQQMRQRESRKR